MPAKGSSRLKREARELMARTGMSYTQALRELQDPSGQGQAEGVENDRPPSGT